MTFLKLNFPGWSCGDVIWCCLLSASSRSHKHNIEPAFTRWVHSWNFYQNFLTLAATMFVNRDIFWVLHESFHILLLATKLAPPVHNSFHFYPINTSLWRPSSIVGDLNLCSCTQYLGSTQHWQTCFLQTYLGPALIKSFTSFPSSSHLYSFIQDSCGISFPCWTKWFAIMWRGERKATLLKKPRLYVGEQIRHGKDLISPSHCSPGVMFWSLFSLTMRYEFDLVTMVKDCPRSL